MLALRQHRASQPGLPERHVRGAASVFLKGPARGRLLQRAASQELEPDPRAPNGQAKRSSEMTLSAGLNTIRHQNGSGAGACCCRHYEKEAHAPAVTTTPAVAMGAAEEEPPLQLHGARTEPSALLKVQGSVHTAAAGGTDVQVQPMIDSGASGMGFVDPAFVQRCGAQLRPSSRRITLADGSEVRAVGEVTLTYSLAARTCHGKGNTPPVRFTSAFIVTPLAPYELILGMG